ncbi:hypothetical protein ARMGADRAFT_218735 [Armillaria gallica]|uniref:F-box domain-containing protein n=1 Tax=Armillaria gallica TaxID=47427 RepID=A0A2H3DUS1_ARMGA|nr:hypothetical protein ARMGADRAFT_218735 [Armillaria gallica]
MPLAREKRCFVLDCKIDAAHCFTEDVLTSDSRPLRQVQKGVHLPLTISSSAKLSSTNTIHLNVKMLLSAYCLRCNYNRHLLSPNYNILAPLRMYELLNLNDPPFRAKYVHLENTIIQSNGTLAKLQDQITEARAELDELLEEEARVQDTIESCKTILQDILREFFSASVDADREGTDSLSGKFAPLVLSQVCRNWRSTALSTCRLWSSLRLDFDLYRNDMASLYLLQTYLLRSGMHNITLSIHIKTYLSKSHLIPILILSAPRWTDLSLTITHNSVYAFSAARGTFHRLNRLSPEVIGPILRAREDLARCTFNAFEYALLLRSFTLQRMCAAVQEISLPWSQLNEYTGDDWMSSYIAHAPDMKRASLQCDGESEYDHEDHPSMSHQALRILHVHEAEDSRNSRILSDGGIVRLLSYIEFPALESLSMSYMHTSIRVPCTLRGPTASSLRSLH